MVGPIQLRSVHAPALLIAMIVSPLLAQPQTPQGADQWKPVESALGRSGKAQPDGSYKFAMPRKDMNVTVAGTQVKAGFALGSWAAFKGSGTHAMVMGDLVLSESELEPVMLKLEQGGMEITAVHNHLLNETPRVMYMHIAGHGDAAKMAQTIHDALALTRTPAADTAPAPEQKIDLDTAQIDKALGRQGKNNGSICSRSRGRSRSPTTE